MRVPFSLLLVGLAAVAVLVSGDTAPTLPTLTNGLEQLQLTSDKLIFNEPSQSHST